jgi:hypothetical protein
MNLIYSLIKLRQSHHYYHHFSTLMVLLFYGYLVYFIATALTITFLYLLSCKAISHTRIVALVLFPRWCKRLVCVELYQRLIELERTFILPLASRWVRHSYLSKGLHTIPYTCRISATASYVRWRLPSGTTPQKRRAHFWLSCYMIWISIQSGVGEQKCLNAKI